MILNKIKEFILRRRKILLIIFFTFFIFHFDFTFALDEITKKEASDSIIEILNTILRIGASLIALMTHLIGWFLTPGWTTGSVFGFESKIKDLWIISSNIVYLLFAIVFIWIAFMNIIGKTGEWELKQALPKFIVGVLIVPFSWFIVSAMIGLSGILTASVLSLPKETFPEYQTSLDNKKFCTEYTFNLGDALKDNVKPIDCAQSDEEQKTFGEFMTDQNNIFGIMNIFTFGIMHINDNGILNKGDLTSGIKSLTDLTTKGILDILFFLTYFILMLALFLALFVRGFYLWFFMFLSPFFGLFYFFGNKGPVDALAKKFSIDKFIGLVMMPVYVAGALAFGLLFIFIAGQGMDENTGDCNPNDKNKLCYNVVEEVGDDGENKTKSTLTFLGIKFNFNGTFSDSGKKEELFGHFKGAFGQLILQVFGLVVLRIMVMAALESSELTKEVIAPFKQIGTSVGEMAMKAPTYMPIVPTKTGALTARDLSSFASTVEQHVRGSSNRKGASLAEGLFGEGNALQKVLRDIKNGGIKTVTDKQQREAFNKVLAALGKINKADFRDTDLSILSKFGIDPKKIKFSENKRDLANSIIKAMDNEHKRILFEGKTNITAEDIIPKLGADLSNLSSDSKTQVSNINNINVKLDDKIIAKTKAGGSEVLNIDETVNNIISTYGKNSLHKGYMLEGADLTSKQREDIRKKLNEKLKGG